LQDIIAPVDRDSAVRTLKAHECELRARGVLRAALFGSVARGEAGPSSDVDVMIVVDPAARLGVFEYAALVDYLGTLFASPVDVANHAKLKAPIRSRIERDAVYAF
jgi:predicted nucleotidyltransferase